jgi:transcription elongation factor Elf1
MKSETMKGAEGRKHLTEQEMLDQPKEQVIERQFKNNCDYGFKQPNVNRFVRLAFEIGFENGLNYAKYSNHPDAKLQEYANQATGQPKEPESKSFGKDNHLFNCPFCNGAEKDSIVVLGYKHPYYRVTCTSCGCMVEDDRKDKVQAAWNMRNGVTWLERGQLAQSKQGSVPEQDKAWDLLYKHLEGCEDWSSGQRVDRESFIELGKKEFIIIPR